MADCPTCGGPVPSRTGGTPKTELAAHRRTAACVERLARTMLGVTPDPEAPLPPQITAEHDHVRDRYPSCAWTEAEWLAALRADDKLYHRILGGMIPRQRRR